MLATAMPTFTPWSITHGVVLIAFAIFTGAIIALGLRGRGTPRARTLEQALGVGGLIAWVIFNGYGLLPRYFDWDWSLPIQVCDLAALAAPLVMLRASPAAWLRAWLYFAGIGLCTQAFITPTLRVGPAGLNFWAFWAGHFMILAFALYELLVRRWRPTWRHWRLALALSVGYLALVLPLNVAFGLNYGFLGRKEYPDTILEWLGPWPWRVLVIALLTLIGYTALMLPWVLLRRRRADEH